LLDSRSREAESGEDFDTLLHFYDGFKESVHGLRKQDHKQAFDDLLNIIDIMIERWREIYYQARFIEPKPILKISDNYVVAKPLTSKSKNLFVGRQEYFEIIDDIWKNQAQKPSIVLYGQRRMGKTSLLYQIESKLGSSYITVLVDFQGLGPQIKKETDFWRLITKQIQRELESRNIKIDQQENVADIDPVEEFDNYLYGIENSLLDNQWLVILIDEFEKIEEKIDAGIVKNDVFDSLRHIIQHREKIIILLAGHHTLEERMKQYWNPLMETAINLKLSYLTEDEARQLIMSPWDDFELKYDKQGVEQIIQVCGGQPLLIQLVCKGVIKKVNQRLKDAGGSVSPTASLTEIESVLQRLVIADDHDTDTITFFFDAVWNWLKKDEKAYLVELAKIATLTKSGWVTASDMADIGNNNAMLERLVNRDVLERENNRYRFRVDLLKQWVIHKFGNKETFCKSNGILTNENK
jgi:AAA+ ATPase superfamily predicted ATPase